MWDSPDGKKTWNSSVQSLDYEVLLVSQFTLYGTTKGNKPDFHHSMSPSIAKPFYEEFVTTVKKMYKSDKVQSGIFGAMMKVDLSNDGPVTFNLERTIQDDNNEAKDKKTTAPAPAPAAVPEPQVESKTEN